MTSDKQAQDNRRHVAAALRIAIKHRFEAQAYEDIVMLLEQVTLAD